MAEWISLVVLEALSLVLAEVEALVGALSRGSCAVEAVSALALVVVGVGKEETVRVLVTKGHLTLSHSAPEKCTKKDDVIRRCH